MQASFFGEPEAVSLLDRLHEFCAERGLEAYLVGGYIRDGLLGRGSGDIDLAVAGDALAIAREAADELQGTFVLLDELHQIARVVVNRNEQRMHLDFASVRGSIENDLALRDFTIDAIGMRLEHAMPGWTTVPLVDPVGGAQDLEQGRVRAVDDAVFRNDPGRLLRTFRLAAELDFTIVDGTADLVRRDCQLVAGVSPERLHDELSKLLETPRAGRLLRQLGQLGLLDLIIPELAAARGTEQPQEHFWDVFDHSIESVDAVERLLRESAADGLLPPAGHYARAADYFNAEIAPGRTRRALLKVAALLHDVAKPQAKTIEPGGRIRFLGHAGQGALTAASILERLRFSNREKRMVCKMIEHHLRPGHLSNAAELPTRRAVYRYFRDTADVGIDTLFLSLADHLATRGPLLEAAGWQQHVEITQYIIAQWLDDRVTIAPPRLINGHDLMSEFDLAAGPTIGRLLNATREAQASGEVGTREEAIEFVRKELSKISCAEEM